MGQQRGKKLNQLQKVLPDGFLASTAWLVKHGYTTDMLTRYVQRGWLESPARGVYRRPGSATKWQQVVASLQLLEGSYFHVGGRTALVHRGLGHYVELRGPETILLFGPGPLPPWVNKLALSEHFAVRSDTMFGPLRVRRDEKGGYHDFPADRPVETARVGDLGLNEFSWGAWHWTLLYSSEERAILEILQDVPERESVYEAYVLLQGLVNLRPGRLTKLLMACRSVKVKRLFLALAERHAHAWFNHLDVKQIDLGSGKRMLMPGGKLDAKYGITLPSDLDAHAR